MSFINRSGRRAAVVLTSSVVALAVPMALSASVAHAAGSDRDGDGMPNRWEIRHGLNPNVANARADKDKDRLSNIAEFRRHTRPSNEDSDGDGHDDGDEVRDRFRSTNVHHADTDGDGVRDGDEDADRDGIDNEDEDDARERCRFEDEDRDGDHVDDEDENELGLAKAKADSDGNGVLDGDEDSDEDGESNEDMDDALDDRCADDSEDDGDRLGSIVSFDSATGALTIDTDTIGIITFKVTDETEVEIDDSDEEGSTADLVAGAVVAEVDIDDDTGALEEIELAGSGGVNDDD
jgi:hypothetical protein